MTALDWFLVLFGALVSWSYVRYWCARFRNEYNGSGKFWRTNKPWSNHWKLVYKPGVHFVHSVLKAFIP